MAATVLGIDLGTSSVKVVLSALDGSVLARADADYAVKRPQAGWAETDPQAWWAAVQQAVGQVVARGAGAPPAAIGLSGQMHGVVLCDADGTPRRPAVLWADARAEAELAAYRALPPAVLARLANPLSPGMAGPILAWLQRHEPDVVAGARHAVQPKDWLRSRLTGSMASEPSDASATLLYDVLADDWDGDVIAALGLRSDLLAGLLPQPDDCAGTLRGDAAAELGLPSGIPVAAGAGDTAAAALGSGLFTNGTVQLTIGTGVQIVTPVAAPTAAQVRDRHRPVTHLYRSAVPDGWYAMAAGLTGGATLGWVRTVLGVDWPEVYAAAARGPRADDPVFLPHLIGERTPYMDTHLRGSWSGLSAHHDRAALLYAALEGVAFATAAALDALPGVPLTGRSLRLAGGGTTDPAWRALLADVLDAELDAVDVPDSSVRGAALLGARAAGLLTRAELEVAAAPRLSRIAAPGPNAELLRDRRALYLDTLWALRTLRSAP